MTQIAIDAGLYETKGVQIKDAVVLRLATAKNNRTEKPVNNITAPKTRYSTLWRNMATLKPSRALLAHWKVS